MHATKPFTKHISIAILTAIISILIIVGSLLTPRKMTIEECQAQAQFHVKEYRDAHGKDPDPNLVYVCEGNVFTLGGEAR